MCTERDSNLSTQHYSPPVCLSPFWTKTRSEPTRAQTMPPYDLSHVMLYLEQISLIQLQFLWQVFSFCLRCRKRSSSPWCCGSFAFLLLSGLPLKSKMKLWWLDHCILKNLFCGRRSFQFRLCSSIISIHFFDLFLISSLPESKHGPLSVSGSSAFSRVLFVLSLPSPFEYFASLETDSSGPLLHKEFGRRYLNFKWNHDREISPCFVCHSIPSNLIFFLFD